MAELGGYLGRIQLSSLSASTSDAIELITGLMPSEHARILDLGCDGMQMFHDLSERTSLRKENFFGVDYQTESMQRAREGGFNAYRADLSHEEFPSEIYDIDVAFSLQTIEHLINPCFFLKNVYRVLKPGGHFVVTTPNQAAWFNIVHLVFGLPPSSGPHKDCEVVRRKLALFI